MHAEFSLVWCRNMSGTVAVNLHMSWCLTWGVWLVTWKRATLTTPDSGWTFRRRRGGERRDAAAQEDRTDAFTVLAGVINTLSSAFPIKCTLTHSNNFPLMWQHGTNRKHPWKKQPTHTSFKWPQLSSRDYKVCVCVCALLEQMWVAAVLVRDRDLLYLDCNSIRAQGVTP